MLGATPLMPKSAGVAAEQATVKVAEVTTHETLPFLDRVFTALTLRAWTPKAFSPVSVSRADSTSDCHNFLHPDTVKSRHCVRAGLHPTAEAILSVPTSFLPLLCNLPNTFSYLQVISSAQKHVSMIVYVN